MSRLFVRLFQLVALLMPPLGVAAPKSVVVILLLVGLAGLGVWAKNGYPAFPLNRGLVAVLILTAVWAAVASSWAPAPTEGITLTLRVAGLCIAGLGFLYGTLRLDPVLAKSVSAPLVAGFILGFLVLGIGFSYAKVSGSSLWSTFKADPLTTLNNGAVALGLVAWAVFAVVWRRGWKRVAVIGAAALYGFYPFLSSTISLVAPVVGIGGFVMVWLFGRRGATVLAAASVVVSLLVPQAVSTIVPMIPMDESSTLSSTQHRLKIWAFTADKISEKPLLGWGMDSSRAIPGGDLHLLPQAELLPLHPHNIFLQVRLELGLPGALLLAAFLWGLFHAGIGRMDDRFAAAMTAGTGCAYLTIAASSYGIWQNWWIALAWILAALTALALRPNSSGSPAPS